MARHLIYKTPEGDLISTADLDYRPTVKAIERHKAATGGLRPGELRHLNINHIGTSIGGTVNPEKYVEENINKTGLDAHANARAPGIGRSQQMSEASWHAAYNRLRRSAEMARWIKENVLPTDSD